MGGSGETRDRRREAAMRKAATTGLLLGVCIVVHAGVRVREVSPGDKDLFGVRELFPTRSGGRQWFAKWEARRTIKPFQVDPQDAFFRNEDGPLKIGDGIASIAPGQTRFVILTPKDAAGRYTAPLWKNVEMTVYVRRGPTSRSPSYQAFDLSARSGEHHNDQMPCEGTSYHATARFVGQCGFKKEIWHTGGYTHLAPGRAPRPWQTVPEGKWIGMKFVCRNVDHDRHVSLQLYLDAEERNAWRRVVEYTDAGGWKGEKEGCGRAVDTILREGRPAVYFRTDYVMVDVKKFSVREIEPLP
jgi:hypothetical protein